MKAVLFAIALFWLSVAAYCDESYVTASGGAAEMLKREHPSIRMVSERVYVRLEPTVAHVRCRFVFKNEGPATTVRMGFPDVSAERQHLLSFKSWIDGKQVSTRRIQDITESPEPRGWITSWIVKDVRFGRNQTRTIVDQYDGPIREEGRRTEFTYILTTGANWKGKIGRAEIVVDIVGFSKTYLMETPSPKGYAKKGSKLVWVMRNFEPGEDIGVYFRRPPGPEGKSL